MTELGISFQDANNRELHLIGGAVDLDAAVREALRGLDILGAHHAVIYRGRTLSEGEVVELVHRP